MNVSLPIRLFYKQINEVAEDKEILVSAETGEEAAPAVQKRRRSNQHITSRARCRHCVAGRAISDPHWKRADGDKESECSTCSIDYMRLKELDADGEDVMPDVISHDSKTKGVTAHVVPDRGLNEFAF